jgi:ADP-ribose pyrophosphatase YjhB (NUDIX family)
MPPDYLSYRTGRNRNISSSPARRSPSVRCRDGVLHEVPDVTDRQADGPQSREEPAEPPLNELEYREIYAKVPRLTVEVVVQSPHGILLVKRTEGPCSGLWHIPGGTVRFGEPLVGAVTRVATMELGLEIEAGPLLGFIEYPSHYLNGLDSPVGIAFLCRLDIDLTAVARPGRGWFTAPPDPMHTEQVDFLIEHGLLVADR